MAEPTTDPVRMPPAPRIPKLLQGVGFLAARDKAVAAVSKRFGPTFTLNLPIFGPTVVVGDPALIKELFTAKPDLIARAGVLGEMFGPGRRSASRVPSTVSAASSWFRHFTASGWLAMRRSSKKRSCARSSVARGPGIRDHALDDAHHPQRDPARGVRSGRAALDELRDFCLDGAYASRLAVMPPVVRRDYGPRSPGRKLADNRKPLRRDHRRASSRISAATRRSRTAPTSCRSCCRRGMRTAHRYRRPRGRRIAHAACRGPRDHGHHAGVGGRAVAQASASAGPAEGPRSTRGGSELVQATIWEVQRTRPVINGTARMTKTRMRLGDWVIPERHVVMASISLAHLTEAASPTQRTLIPTGLSATRRTTIRGFPIGGGIRRCIGAAFANMEMKVTLRTLMREFEFGTTYAAGERRHSRGVATAPRRGGRAVVYRRRAVAPLASHRCRAGIGVTANEEVVDVGRGIELCYDQTGDPADPPVILIAGLGQQLHSWPDEFVTTLVGHGYHVTRFDNRDAGRSTHMKYRPPNPVAMFRGGDPRHQYHLGDMARDTVGLMDALGYADAHLVGVSMGGMIAQTVAAHHPGRVRTLTSIMSTTGARRLGRPAPSTWRRMLMSKPPRTRAEAMDRATRNVPPHRIPRLPFRRASGSHICGHRVGPRSEPGRHRASAGGHLRLGGPHGGTRADRRSTLVIHGDRDRMVIRPAAPRPPARYPARDWRPSSASVTTCPSGHGTGSST